jgi:hypothetical protein
MVAISHLARFSLDRFIGLWSFRNIKLVGGKLMKILEGNKLKSKLTGTIFEVKVIKDRSVVLESKDGPEQEWTDMGNLPLFFEEAENHSSL